MVMQKMMRSVASCMNARVIGSGEETVILAHGYGGDQSVWDKIIHTLALCCRVIVFDWAFSGSASDPDLFDPTRHANSFHGFVDDLVNLLDELDVKSAVFVGHSMSGMIGCLASVRRPDLFKHLVLVAASPRYIDTDDYEGGFKESEVEELLKCMESDFDTWATEFPTLAIDGSDPASVEIFRRTIRKMSPAVALAVANTVFRSDERELLGKVSTRCTIVQPSNDAVVPVSVGYFMQKRVGAEAVVEVIECDGHFPHLTAHVKLLDLLARVLELNLLVV